MPASFIGRNTVRQGYWSGQYGRDGYHVLAGSTYSVLPSYVSSVAHANTGGGGFFSWAAGDSNARAIRRPPPADQSTGDRYAYFGNTTVTVTVTLADTTPRVFSAYFLDPESGSRSQTVEILSSSDVVLDAARAMSSFTGGLYYTWLVNESFKLRLTKTGSFNAVYSSLFFDPHHRNLAGSLPSNGFGNFAF
ncbi:hypothetical protein [Paludisphaera soli]|uniref:hypothetical protein n=1 Tax=Paludisphaera soli TaxID=2712865 RepID=UPI0013EA0AD8|nr:hypothetical protein [Paludisphaera soli]